MAEAPTNYGQELRNADEGIEGDTHRIPVVQGLAINLAVQPALETKKVTIRDLTLSHLPR